jgi:uncharacterized protein
MQHQQYQFEWDNQKAQTNLRKHGVSFAQATAVFRDAQALTIYDEEHSDFEDRWLTIGWVEGFSELVVVHTFIETSSDNAKIRIISARAANKHEAQQYQASFLK